MIRQIDRRIGRALATVRQGLRAVLGTVDASKPLASAQAEGLNGETFADVELVQQYGFVSVPLAGADAVILPMGGRSAHGVVVAVDDARHRLADLQAGEVALYTDENARNGGHRLALKRDQKLELRGAALDAKATGAVAIEAGTTATIKAPNQVNLDTPLTTVSGNITTGGAGKTFSSTGTWCHTGDVTITGNLTVNGNLQVNGNINATGNIIDGGSNTNHHTH
jgi:phage baseplate assembly protein V